jgi:VWFA-related protein
VIGRPACALALVAAALAVVSAQDQDAKVVIKSPSAETVLIGPAKLAADVLPPGAPVELVTFFVDGREVCRATARPFGCDWDAGGRADARSVRVVATLAGGARVAATVRTKGLALDDTAQVDSVLVAAHVTDNKGRFVGGLKLADFAVTEDGVPQTLSFMDEEDSPSDVVLLLDASGSMGGSMSELRLAAFAFLRALRPQDTSIVAAFNTALTVVSPRGEAFEPRAASMAKIQPGGATALYDAIIRAVDLTSAKSGRHAIAVFTDGDDVASRASIDNARQSLQSQDVLLYVIATGKAADDKNLREQLTALAAETGGRAFFGSRMANAVTHFDDIIEDLAHQYVVGYSPKRAVGDGGWRKLTLTVKNRNLEVRARQGYFAVRKKTGG